MSNLAINAAQGLSCRDLRERLVFQRKIVTGQDSYGQDVYTWSNLFTAHAHIYALQGREMERVQQRWAEARFAARMHRNVLTWEPTRANRVLWRSRMLDLLDIEDPHGADQWCVAYFKEHVD